jgi:hypothetical protein
MCKIPFILWIANAAARFSGRRGAARQAARDHACSRQTVYLHAGKVHAAVQSEHSGLPSRQRLLRENLELGRENAQLWEWLDQTIEFPRPKQKELAVKAAAMGLSSNQIVDLLAILLGVKAAPGRSTVHRWVQAAAKVAGRVLKDLDQRCQTLVKTACLDEIFFHRRPVLVGLEPASMVLFLTQKCERLSRSAWVKRLSAWKALQYVVGDAGVILQSAISWVRKQRKAGEAKLQSSLDVFHTAKEAHRVLKILWNRVKKDWKVMEKADLRVVKIKNTGAYAYAAAGAARSAAVKVAKSMECYDAARSGWKTAKAALELFRPDGHLNDRAWAQARVAEALTALAGRAWTTLRNLLQTRAAFTFLDRLHAQLRELPIGRELSQALVRLWWLRHRCRGAHQDGEHAKLILVQQVICAKLAPDWLTWYEKVAKTLRTTVRASSLIECVNSILRMHQSRHRNVTQGLLDLKRLYWNTRKFRKGRRRGRCPYQILGLELPGYDFWTLVQKEMAEPKLQNQAQESQSLTTA